MDIKTNATELRLIKISYFCPSKNKRYE